MKVIYTDPFKRDYVGLPIRVQRALGKALRFLLDNPRHPSLRVKKLPGTEIWYVRITREYRFTFQLGGDIATLRRVGTHDILRTERK